MTTPPLAPEIQAVLDATNDPFLHDPDAIFATTQHFEAMRAVPEVPLDDRVAVDDRVTASGLRLRVYDPKGETNDRPLIVLLHSGGWVYWRPESEEARALQYAAEVGAVVVSVDYRHAPEHPSPAAADDAYEGLVWAAAHAAELRADPNRVAVVGGSAGGNLAALTALRARDSGGPMLRFQLLLYPALDDRMNTQSAIDYVNIPVLTSSALGKAWEYYLSGAAPSEQSAPARAAHLGDLPPTLIMVAEVDPMRDEGIDYAKRLSAAGVSTELVQIPGTVHGFDLMFAKTDVGQRGLALQVRALRAALTRAGDERKLA